MNLKYPEDFINQIIHGDCLEVMPVIPDGVVDMIFCDLPYGMTNNRWDKVISFESLWKEYKRIIKTNGAIVLTSQQPFATDLINSARRLFRYEIIWEKTMAQGFLNANKMPLRAHENILVFYKSLPTYNPQKTYGPVKRKGKTIRRGSTSNYTQVKDNEYIDDGSRYPKSVVKISNGNYQSLHPTQKPIKLVEWFIRTYSNAGDLILDNCVGSGTPPLCCLKNSRRFIGIEKELDFVRIAKARINSINLN